MIMIEQIARKLSQKHWNNEKRWENYIYIVKEVLETMHEPTQEMIKAGDSGFALQQGSSAYACWQAMIDAALKN